MSTKKSNQNESKTLAAIDRTVKIISALYDVSPDDVWAKGGESKVCLVRGICFYILSEVNGFTGVELGPIFNRTKQGVTKASKVVRDLMPFDKHLRAQVEAIVKLFTNEDLKKCHQL